MKDFKISLPNRAGELANLTEILSGNDINIESVAGISEANKAVVTLLTDDVAKTRNALQNGRVQFEQEEILAVDLEDKQGSWLK